MDLGRQESQDEGNRFWREEREEGAVYMVYLKRVTYRSHDRLEEGEKFMSHLMWETLKVRVVKAGTLERLVECMETCQGDLDSSHLNVFLSTYRTFASPEQVLKTLINRFIMLKSCAKDDDRKEMVEEQLKTIRSVISVWLDTHPDDFREHPDYPCLLDLEDFAKEHIADSDLGVRARHRLEKFQKEAKTLEESIEEMHLGARHGINGDKNVLFNQISNRSVAEQLTFKDAELFRKVVPHHCLGAVWSRRRKKGGKNPSSVVATIQQFNNVSLRVIATVLNTRGMKTSQRAKILQRWIEIAQELRDLKNFSSLRAIISGLQTHPVYRLRKTWAALPKNIMVLFTELSEIFSNENNQITSRELLMKEATAKFPDIESQNKTLQRRNLLKRQSWIENGIVQGTVPYLGTFLTDLTMIDTAFADITDDNLINFEKHRKEFEVIAQLKLLQSAAQIYQIVKDENFWTWFYSVNVYTDTESHDLSCTIEPPSDSNAKIKKKSASLGHRPVKFDSAKFALFSCGLENRKSMSSIPDTLSTLAAPIMTHHSSTSSVVSSDSDNPSSPFRSSDTYVIRVSVNSTSDSDTHVYKSIMLTNTDHTHTVISKVLEKYCMEGKPEDYRLLQILEDGELLIPERANVFYALNNSSELNFVIKSREDYETSTLKRQKKRRFKKLSL
ncbi:ral guanine nucleotide dissociation stimulator-like 1 isoform X1 [Patella vulgata]|uniref:ral guanine nucleotide dissociation stimulator-like 1 isoform X1 n=1 Tax=Patella vulgata TaxID=6465 RepID=UPI0024A87B02|nr:ral guanine nucleotide dissociation stimulator-like 1 isoform X1 [Patella vulgata]